MDEHEEGGGGFSRRKLLRRAGIAGAAAWTAPLIITGSAQAHSEKACQRQAVDGNNVGCTVCDDQPVCGDRCSCIITHAGCCFCHQITPCAGLTPCTKDSQCPRGWRCAHSCCDTGGQPYCLPPCGDITARPATIPSGTLTSTGIAP